jgi:hypothetical protein
MPELSFIPCYSLSPRALTLYEIPDISYSPGNQSAGWQNLKDNVNKYGDLSEHATKRLKKTIQFMLYLSLDKEIQGKVILSKHQDFTTEYEKGNIHSSPVQHKLSFITLTLPDIQAHSDNTMKKQCLNHFLTFLRRNHNCNLYIWKAEKQDNGNIHFHILINKYIHWQEIRDKWNTIISKLGYIDKYRRKMKEHYKNGFKKSSNNHDTRSISAQYKAYETGQKENWSNPNSTDIHALYKVQNVSAYITKYIAKGISHTDRKKEIVTLSNELSELQNKHTTLESEIYKLYISDKHYKHPEARNNAIKKQIDIISGKLEKLKESGIQGRIWGCSQTLSKCNNFTAEEEPHNIPDINIIERTHEASFTNEVGSRSIKTYIFDINDTPQLKQLLNDHLRNNTKNTQADST